MGDLVGLDTAQKVIKGIAENCPNDEQKEAFAMPAYLNFMLENKFLGNKTRKGFYERTKQKDAAGRRVKLGLNLKTLEYAPTQRVKAPVLDAVKQVESLKGKVRTFFNDKYADDKGACLLYTSPSPRDRG